MGMGCEPHSPTCNLKDQGTSVPQLTQNLPNMCGPASSWAATNIAAEFTGPSKLSHWLKYAPIKVEVQFRGSK